MVFGYIAWIGTAVAADLQAEEPTDDWTHGLVVVADSSASATNGFSPTFTVAGYADGTEYQGFIRWVEHREVEELDR